MKRITAEQASLGLKEALEATGATEVLKASGEGDTVKLVFRVHRKKAWLGILEYVLARAAKWTAHVCQQYFLRDGKLVYGWTFVLRPNSKLDEAIEEARTLLAQASTTVPRLTRSAPDTFPLVAASPRRTARINFDPRAPGPSRDGASHKGAFTIAGE